MYMTPNTVYNIGHKGEKNLISSVTPKCNNISDPRGIYIK